MSHKSHLLSCVLRCSSKLQKIQSLENFASMATQGTQVPIYTNTHYFCIFLIFHKAKLKTSKKKTWKKHTKHKTRLTQNKKEKQTSNA